GTEHGNNNVNIPGCQGHCLTLAASQCITRNRKRCACLRLREPLMHVELLPPG
ncbi:hypothetical protein HAX54_006397, partial [Datura stramonium]|nr:hypothetical protein [Datura stramonium]